MPSLSSGLRVGGKSTLVRRVLARLIDQGRVVVADASTGLPLDEADVYRRRLAELALTGRPVILLLDDPLYAESPWLDLLPKLVHSNLRLGLIAATPTFLFDRHHKRLFPQHIISHRYDMQLPTDDERQRFAELYGRARQEVSNETDFLVLAMELATGQPFDQIIAKLWWTLNDDRPPPAPDEPVARLNWPARAFLVVCFFHRAYVPCLEPLVEKALELSGGIESGISVAEALAHLRFTEGWHVFQLREAEISNWAFKGRYVMAAHHRIAQRAYELRPVPSADFGPLVIKASLAAPQTVREVGALAGILADASDESDQRFAERLVNEWISAAEEGLIETRNLCDLAASLQINGRHRLAHRWYEVLISRAATCNQDAWLAALSLWYLSGEHPASRAYPPELDLLSLVQRGDFSIAPKRAIAFATTLPRRGLAETALKERLSQALKGEVPWRLDSHLLTWLLAKSQADQFSSLFSAVQAWLKGHKDDSSVRTQLLVFLLKLPNEKEFDNVREEVAQETVDWLKGHKDDSFVRTQLLAFLLKLPKGFDNVGDEVAKETLDWLRNHPEDTCVRVKLCDFLLRLPRRFKGLRQVAASALMDWLVSIPVAGMPPEFLTQQAVKETALLSLEVIAKAGSIEDLSCALLWGIKLLNQHGSRNDIDDYVTAMVDVYHELAPKSQSLADPTRAYDILRLAKRAIGGWCDQNPTAIGYPWL